MIFTAFSPDYIKLPKNDKYIWINGVFDIFHLQHLKMINYAKRTFPNHKIIVGINSDKSVREMDKKHPLIFDQNYRAEFLQELVDIVVIYDEFYDYLRLIKDFKPDFIVKGEEYADKDIPEKKLGINVIYYYSNSKISSTETYNNIIKKFQEAKEI
jgi:choline-phosphate cytidylyltransferase/glycerol-3-phosphate cytidylyltransferase